MVGTIVRGRTEPPGSEPSALRQHPAGNVSVYMYVGAGVGDGLGAPVVISKHLQAPEVWWKSSADVCLSQLKVPPPLSVNSKPKHCEGAPELVWAVHKLAHSA